MGRQASLLAVGLALLTTIAGCAAPSARTGDAKALPSEVTFTCCKPSDIKPVRHPGETFEIHWIMNRISTTQASNPVEVELDVSLSGGYGTVQQLKDAAGIDNDVLARAPTVITSNFATTQAVSVITIPAGTPPGLYNLNPSIASAGSILSGSSIIRIDKP